MTLVLPALPFTACFVGGMKNGYVQEYLSRTTRKRYLWGKRIDCAVSGGSVPAVGILAAHIIGGTFFIPIPFSPNARTARDRLNSLAAVQRFRTGPVESRWIKTGLQLTMDGVKYRF